MVTTDTNIATVQEIYGAFGRGDVPAILELLADDVRWEEWADNFAQRDNAAPDMEPKTGRDGVGEFFGLVGQWEVESFDVLSIMAGGNQVAAEIEIAARLPNGGRFRDEELHLWTFDEDGKVSRLRHYTDTAKHIAAARGEDTTA
jgi:uncharacterized protein